MSTSKKNNNLILIIGGIVIVLGIVIYLVMSISASNARNAEATQIVEQAMALAETEAAAPTATAEITATMEPSPTATVEATPEPTSTPIPPLGLSENGLILWSAPVGIGLIPANFKDNQDAYGDVSLGYEENGGMVIKIPASFIVIDAHFNQPIPSGVLLKVYELKAVLSLVHSTHVSFP